MTTINLGLFIWGLLLTLQVMQNMKRIDKLSWDLAHKMDKPEEETPTEKFMRERKEKTETKG
ncbi:MAG: hypothetical protein RL150_248 [Candidatus Parcubacteria bacterium]|jgi:hypothetical protein